MPCKDGCSVLTLRPAPCTTAFFPPHCDTRNLANSRMRTESLFFTPGDECKTSARSHARKRNYK